MINSGRLTKSSPGEVTNKSAIAYLQSKGIMTLNEYKTTNINNNISKAVDQLTATIENIVRLKAEIKALQQKLDEQVIKCDEIKRTLREL